MGRLIPGLPVLLGLALLVAGAQAQLLDGPGADRPADFIDERVTIEPDEVVGPIRVGNGHLEILGRVRGSVTATQSPVIVGEGGIVEGDVRSFGGPVTLLAGGAVEGSVTVNAAEGRVKQGGWVAGDLTVFGSDATVETGGEVGGKVLAVGGERLVQSGAMVGGSLGAGQAEDDPGLWGVAILAFIGWLFGTILGGALCYGMADSAGPRTRLIASAWRDQPSRVATWALALLGLIVLLLLVPCVGWVALVAVLGALAGAAALGWAPALQIAAERVSPGRDRSPKAAAMLGFAIWSAVGLIGVVPCLLPFVLVAKWALLMMGAAATLLTDWGRDPAAGGCWPVRGR
ncbi:MAG: hypothetical protein GF320_19350 [Armatimonadia bacterium]|nr:hypothetical protein [Armatimonadia bacterium]